MVLLHVLHFIFHILSLAFFSLMTRMPLEQQKLMEPKLLLIGLCLLSSLTFIIFGVHFAREAARFSDNERSIKTKLKNKRLTTWSFIFSTAFLAFAYYIS
ncbi:MAG: hypothetical protein COV91_01660 [Candidatus Taylorbacteria bacterium CG11_big_fil_rev_8_21_14_0_20_46_11]|uniref:Uncharacterized protein n=1 Tax=Candidatus Taylorbacteria bacterium CG11_big_fil_rev_8_21_14_0_20_46_11 TaxID=1975025 RepID=A0A2H0KCB0_9BACT|nr:MAG: hypothetical protein COV91_01660 [Candidatus Taylorbacteria bacterium CG11_big_fil_rev_8_21_14_0_20_46_11]